MSNSVFMLAFGAGAGLLAMWVHVRFPSLAPERLGRTILHAATAFVLLKLTTHSGGSSTIIATVLLLVLPALVYALLCTLWVLRHAQAALGVSR
jgi:hypothetical protein